MGSKFCVSRSEVLEKDKKLSILKTIKNIGKSYIYVYTLYKKRTGVQWIFTKYPPLGGIRFGLEAELGQGGDTFLLGKYSSIPPGGDTRLAWERGDKSN